MKSFSYGLLLTLPLLSACGGESSFASVPQAAALQQGQLRAAESNAQDVFKPFSLSGSSDLLYIGNTGNNSISVYRHDASGNTAPLYVIEGSKTGIVAPGQLSADAQSNLYVATNGVNSANPAVLVFAHGAKGNVAPIRKLAGPLTGFHQISAMTVDRMTGKLFVVDDTGGEGAPGNLLRFPPNASGNEAPFARGAIFAWATQIASDSTAKNIIEAHVPVCCRSASAGVDTYAKQFANNVAPTLVHTVSALNAAGVADDPTTKTYLVASSGYGIYRLAENTAGMGPIGGSQTLSPAPVSIITSDTCGGQIAVAQGPTPYTYVTHNSASGCPTDAVYVYANNATGNATPIRVLSGPATGLNAPYGIYEGN